MYFGLEVDVPAGGRPSGQMARNDRYGHSSLRLFLVKSLQSESRNTGGIIQS